MPRSKAAEASTIEAMIGIYCRGRHGGKVLCAGCAELRDYALARLGACPHDPKPACRDCRTHCYRPDMRAKVREVMAYAGRRMAWRHPLRFLRHLFGK